MTEYGGQTTDGRRQETEGRILGNQDISVSGKKGWGLLIKLTWLRCSLIGLNVRQVGIGQAD